MDNHSAPAVLNGARRCAVAGHAWLRKRQVTLALGPWLALLMVLSACGSSSVPEPPTSHEPGRLAQEQDRFGTFYAYVPTTLPDRPQILVLVHGTPPKDKTAE